MNPIRCFMVGGVDDAYSGPREYRVGAMWWRRHTQPVSEMDTNPRPLPHLAVMTPAGMACLDCPSALPPPGRYWIWTGEPPDITVTPSLDIRGDHPWHGWVTDGTMKDA